ncbi:hypothetical protein ROE7235_01363 [Roseibaca ekhonensis]|uniref:Uncharacterized protein n=1 Tax=Roseinatronobacter ekhonensis TaxID=254356 RepID=A0A3B0M7F3_9RHOB|nr:hypothetical protein ROE7235_01363 [Roseibaca ekhonensis]
MRANQLGKLLVKQTASDSCLQLFDIEIIDADGRYPGVVRAVAYLVVKCEALLIMANCDLIGGQRIAGEVRRHVGGRELPFAQRNLMLELRHRAR